MSPETGSRMKLVHEALHQPLNAEEYKDKKEKKKFLKAESKKAPKKSATWNLRRLSNESEEGLTGSLRDAEILAPFSSRGHDQAMEFSLMKSDPG